MVINAFESVTQMPQPPAAPIIHRCLDNCIEIRWKEPMRRDCVPEVLYYEVEGINPGDGTVFHLASSHTSLSDSFCDVVI